MRQKIWMLLVLTLFMMFICQPGMAKTSKGEIRPPKPIAAEKYSAKEKSGPDRYIIKLADPPLALYSGGIAGLTATSLRMTGKAKLNVNHTDSLAYRNHLSQKRRALKSGMGKILGRTVKFIYEYSVAFNGAVVSLNTQEAAAIEKLPGVVSIQKDVLQKMHTDVGPAWIGAPDIWNGTVGAGTYGEGIVVGVIDTGINPENPSFVDIGGDGYDHSNPRGQYYGACDPADPNYEPTFPCNDKLIGAYDFTPLVPDPGNNETPWDVDGHGSHTASTAAGNVVEGAAVEAPTTTITRDISGVAPHANIISYRCIRSNGGGWTSVLVAAIEQAVTDGVDVINYSIGSGASDPWNSPIAEAFLAARQLGIFVATSAGNNGPGSETVGSPGNAPWVLTVGASTHDRQFNNLLTGLTEDGEPSLSDITGKSISAGYGPAGIVYAGDYTNPNDPDNDPGLCLEPFPSGTFSGEIVVCDRGQIARIDKGDNVLQGGAGGFVLANDASNGDSLNSDTHYLPAVHITYNDGVTLKSWLDSESNQSASIAGTSIKIAAGNGDIMAAFSSRGANAPVPSIIKPDVTAPGVDIMAAYGTYGAVTYGVIGGTSMSSPHAAGAAALLKALHPTWSPAGIQSALMSTSVTSVFKEDGATSADPFDMGAGRIDVSTSAQAGFVLDETYGNFVAANPEAGGDPAELNLASLGNAKCIFSDSWTRVLKSTMNTNIQWTASVINPPDVTLTVVPTVFTLQAGGTRKITISANVSQAPFDEWRFGQVCFIPNNGDVAVAHFPVAIKSRASNLPDLVVVKEANTAGVRTLEDVKAIEITDLDVTLYGLGPADVLEDILYQDTTPDNYSDDITPEEGVFRERRYVYSGKKRLVAEIVESTSPDLDLYVWYYDTSWHLMCASNSFSAFEYCSIDDPGQGWYDIYVQNWAASDPSGSIPDTFKLAVAEVPGEDSGNMTVAVHDSSTSVPGGQPFDLDIGWNLTWTSPYWYGAFSLGTDPGHPGNLGIMNVNIAAAICEGDFDEDRDVDGSDLAVFAADFGRTDCSGDCEGDFDNDGDVDGSDLAVFAADFGRTDCPNWGIE